MPFTRLQLREILDRSLRSDSDFDAFAYDRFPDVSHRFTNGMDRVRKTNILLLYAEPLRLEEALRGLGGSSIPVEPSPAAGRIKVLFLASNPMAMGQLQFTREARQIEERLAVGRSRDAFVFVAKWAVRRSELPRLLLEEKPHVLHFSGHGSTRAQLLFEDDDGNAAPIEKKALVNLIGILKHRLQLVVLNGCNTEPLASALVQHVASAIGVRGSIDNPAAIAFAVSFYQAIACDEPVPTAFQLACAELDLQQLPGKQTPTLKVKKGVDASTLLLKGP
jgi:hypothetical protein